MALYNGKSVVFGATVSESPVVIKQTLGDSPQAVMSQKAVTENFENILYAFELENVGHNLIDPSNTAKGYYTYENGAITFTSNSWSACTVDAIPLPNGTKNVYISTNADISDTNIASRQATIWFVDEVGKLRDNKSMKWSNLPQSVAVPSGATHFLYDTNGANLGLTLANICISVVDVPFEEYTTKKAVVGLNPSIIPSYLSEQDVNKSGYNTDALLRENAQLKRDLAFMSQRQSGLYDLKSGATVDSQTVTLKNTSKQNLILHIHRYANNGFDTTNDVFLPNAKRNFSDLRITDNRGNVLPYFINKISELDVVEDGRLSTLQGETIVKDSHGNLIAKKGYGVSRSTDGGESWEQIEGLTGVTFNTVVTINPDDSLLLGSGSTRKLYKSYAPYTSYTEVLDCSNFAEEVTFKSECMKRLKDGSLIFGAYQAEKSARMYKSTDNGSTWMLKYENTNYQHVHQVYVDRSQDVETIYAGLDMGGGVIKSTDGGETWVDLRTLHPEMPQSTDFGVFYAEDGVRLLSGETFCNSGHSIIRTEDDITFTPVLSIGNGVFCAKKLGGYIVAGLGGSGIARSHGIIVSKDKGLTWDKIYTTSPFTDSEGTCDGYRRMDDTIFENTIIAHCQSTSRRPVRITAHEEPIYAEIIVEVPENTASITVENGYAIGNTIIKHSDFEPTNRKLLYYPLNEGGNFVKESVSGNVYKGNFEYTNRGKNFGGVLNNKSVLLSSLKGFTSTITLPNKFTISFWDNRPSEDVNAEFNLIRKGSNRLRIFRHTLHFNDIHVANPFYPFIGGMQKIDIVFDGEAKTIKHFMNGKYRGKQYDTVDVESIINAFVGEGEITILRPEKCESERSIQHFTIYDGILSEDDMLQSVHFELSDNHQTA